MKNEAKNKRIKLMAERLFFLDPNVQMTVIVTLKGEVTTEEIVEAVKKTYTQNQTTMSKFVMDKKGNLYLEEMEQTGCKVYVDEREWREIKFENERKALRVNEGELVRTFVIPRGEEKDIYITAHHLMCDGFGLFIMIEDMMNNLSGNRVEYKPTKVLTKKDAIRRGDLDFKSKLGLRLCNSKWKKERKVFGWEEYYRISDEFWKNKRTEIKLEEIEGKELSDLKRRCKEIGISLNSYLVARELQKMPECRNIGIPVSLRGEERSISNLITSVAVCYQYDKTKTFEENAKAVNEEIRKQIKSEGARYHISQFLSITDPTLVDAALMYYLLGYDSHIAKVMAGIIGYEGEMGTDLGVSNMKEISLPSDWGKFKIIGFIPISPSILTAKKVLGVSSYQEKLLIAESKIIEK